VVMRDALKCGLVQGPQVLCLGREDSGVRLDAVTTCLLLSMESESSKELLSYTGDHMALKELLLCGPDGPATWLSGISWTLKRRRSISRQHASSVAQPSGTSQDSEAEERGPSGSAGVGLQSKTFLRRDSFRESPTGSVHVACQPEGGAGARKLCWLSSDVLDPTLHYEETIPLMTRSENIEHARRAFLTQTNKIVNSLKETRVNLVKHVHSCHFEPSRFTDICGPKNPINNSFLYRISKVSEKIKLAETGRDKVDEQLRRLRGHTLLRDILKADKKKEKAGLI